jgi:hypothetical protein
MSVIGQPAAVVGGWECVVLGVAWREYQRRHGFARMPPADRALVDRAISDLVAVVRVSPHLGRRPAPLA